ncbi:MAG: hypothetical protein LBL58_11835 [Tannerellaceae bacterium]|jgi:hypothetical protein|nr:hypothetical protein [Tannerellaceae bacterium]
MKRLVVNNIAIVAILGFIASGRICLISPEELRIAGKALTAEIAILTLAYFTAVILNIRVLVPRLPVAFRSFRYADIDIQS